MFYSQEDNPSRRNHSPNHLETIHLITTIALPPTIHPITTIALTTFSLVQPAPNCVAQRVKAQLGLGSDSWSGSPSESLSGPGPGLGCNDVRLSVGVGVPVRIYAGMEIWFCCIPNCNLNPDPNLTCTSTTIALASTIPSYL